MTHNICWDLLFLGHTVINKFSWGFQPSATLKIPKTNVANYMHDFRLILLDCNTVLIYHTVTGSVALESVKYDINKVTTLSIYFFVFFMLHQGGHYL